jgi:hypothetical protein
MWVGLLAPGSPTSLLAAASIRTSPPSLEINQNTWSVNALALSGSTLYVGGDFNSISGTPRRSLAAVSTTDGSLQAWNPAPSAGSISIEALAVSGGILYVGGRFSQLEAQARNNLGAFDTASKSLTSWAPQANGTSPSVKALAVSGSTVYLAGSFDHIGGQARSGFAAVDTSGSLTAWSPEATAAGQAFGDALAVSASAVYVGGGFTAVGGQPRNAVAAVDPVTAAPTSWNPEASAGRFVKALALSGSTVYVAGTFTQIGGQGRNGLAGLDATTAAASSWNPNPNATVFPNGFPFGGEVDTVAAAGLQVLAGGSFTSVGGVARNNLAAVDLVTGKATAWNPNVTPIFSLINVPISAISAAGGAVYVGGSFSSVGGQARTDLAALDPTTGAATTWNPGATSAFPENGHVSALLASGSASTLEVASRRWRAAPALFGCHQCGHRRGHELDPGGHGAERRHRTWRLTGLEGRARPHRDRACQGTAMGGRRRPRGRGCHGGA